MNLISKEHLKQQPDLIENRPATAVLFEKPVAPNYSVFKSLLSFLSLVLLSGASVYFWQQLQGQPLWVKLPFGVSIFGGAVGAFLELLLLVTGTPFQRMKNSFTRSIQMIRFLNIAPVVTSIFFFVCSFCLVDIDLKIGILYACGAATVAMGAALYLGGARATMPMVILGIQIAQIAVVLLSGILSTPNYWIGVYLIAQAIIQTTAFLIGTTTPMKSTFFHVLSTVSGVLLFLTIREALAINSNYISLHTIALGSSFLKSGLALSCLLGWIFIMKSSPTTYSSLRTKMSNAIWSPLYFVLIGAKRFPNPKNLTEVYSKTPPQPSKLRPYYQQHPEFLSDTLSIPAVERLEGNVTAFGTLVKKIKKMFKLIALLDHFFPQADINIPLKDKPRMAVWSNGEDIYPKIFTKTLFGTSLPNTEFKQTPPPAIRYFKEGQLLAYLAEYGIANPFLRKASERDGLLVLDFSELENYKTKADYEPYGGKAYFKIDEEEKCLKVVSVVAPNSDQEIKANPIDGTFRHIEKIVLASIYFQVISGKHLAGIHMSYNLLEVVLHNAFDAQGQYNHPFRTFMYLHLFSHELAEELTTEHLLQDGAVFSQVFALTHSDLINHLNKYYHDFEYASDENFEYRQEIMQMSNGETLPNACINWEMEYVAIWQSYTDQLIDIIYKTDEDVQNDIYIQDMYRGLKQVFFNGLPKRHEELKTKKGLSRWASDTIHHLVVRHQVYGTTGINAAMDPRISTTQVPKDGGTQGINEWRSLASVGLATACARFTLLLDESAGDFLYLLEGVDTKYAEPMKPVFVELHQKLRDLDDRWTETESEKEFNYNYFRATPSSLHTGPGY